MSDPVDHAAEALKLLTSDRADAATVYALLDIAAAIRESSTSARCHRLVPKGWRDGGKQCILRRDHPGGHESENGVTWP